MRAQVQQVADGVYLVHGCNTNWVILNDGDAVTLDRHRLSRRPAGAARLPCRRGQFTGGGDGRADHPRAQRPPRLGRVPARRPRHPGPAAPGRSPARPAGLPPAGVRRRRRAQRAGGPACCRGWCMCCAPAAPSTSRWRRPQPFPRAARSICPGARYPCTPRATRTATAPTTSRRRGGDLRGRPDQRARHRPDPGAAAAARHVPPRAGRALASLEILAGLDGDVLLPGHGPVHRGSVKEAALLARERAA